MTELTIDADIVKALEKNMKKDYLDILSEKENHAVEVFLNNHTCSCFEGNDNLPVETRKKLVKQNVSVKRQPTGIGSVAMVRCGICSEEWDITDYGDW